MTKYIAYGLLRGMQQRTWARIPSSRLLAIFLILGAWPLATQGQVVVKVNDSVQMRFGLFEQTWMDWTQDPNSGGYSQNIFLRRIRFMVSADVAPNVNIFYQTDDPRLGNAGTNGAKAVNTGFETQDAFVEWKVAGDALMLDGGFFYTPQSRGVLNSSSANLSFDTPTFGLQQSTPAGSNAGRDWGFGLKGYLLDSHLEYRAGVYDGQRQTVTNQPAPLGPEAGSRNAFRAAARVQYDFFDVEKSYTYVATNRGAKKILAVGAWGDTQGDFKAYGADAIADIPIGKDAVTVETDGLVYDGGTQFQQVVGGLLTPILPKQRVFFTHAGYYFDAVKLQPFVRYERLAYDADKFKTGDQIRYGGGFNWYISGQNLKLTAFYERIVPRVTPTTAQMKDTNHLGLQLQVLYF